MSNPVPDENVKSRSGGGLGETIRVIIVITAPCVGVNILKSLMVLAPSAFLLLILLVS